MPSGFARVLVDQTGGRTFDYAVPEGMELRIGARIRVPLGTRRAVGTVVALPESPEVPDPKPVTGFAGEEAVLPQALLDLAKWIADYYCCGIEAAMRAVLPEVIRKARVGFREVKRARLAGAPDPDGFEALRRRAPAQARVVELLRDHADGLDVPVLIERAEVTRQTLGALVAKGVIVVDSRREGRDPHAGETYLHDQRLEPTPEQRAALDAILPALDAPGEARPFLIHGVTGSGKTEIYLQALERALVLGRAAIVLVPEISLTPQTVERFKSRFADIQGEVAVLHSYLSAGERHDEWHKIQDGRARIVIGPRSAIFAPLTGLGLIIVDEEHESSYKQEEAPRYNARDLAVVRAAREGCVVILGSATPSHESYHNALRGKYRLIELTERVDGRRMPLIRIIDMRLQARGKRKDVLSERLCRAIGDRLEKGEQTILFLNRRGYSTSLVCGACGHVCECAQCSLPMTYHRGRDRLICHLCGSRSRAPARCPSCADPGIRRRGAGTEKVEEAVRRIFPQARIARMDADTMTRKHAHRDTLGAFRARKIDILVGTQMIAKGLHFPNVTLVGIVLADVGLQMADFRASERTFQLLTQVAGRAGRGDVEGEVFVQSFTPHHPAIQFARHHAFRDFHEQDDEFRRTFRFPPHTHMTLVTIRSRSLDKARAVAGRLATELARDPPPDMLIGDPAPAPIERLKEHYRLHITLRSARVRPMTRHLRACVGRVPCPRDVAVVIDVDPMSLL